VVVSRFTSRIELERRKLWNLIPWKKSNGNGGLMTADPFEREFSRIRNEFDSLLQRMWSDMPAFDDFFESRWGLDVDETDTHFIARVPAPGFELDDFDVSVSGNHLVMKAERKESQEGKNGSSYRYGKFQRTIPLPDGAVVDQIDAQYRNGILELKIPKGQQSQAKRITVKAG
jgi:HSP20 family protein